MRGDDASRSAHERLDFLRGYTALQGTDVALAHASRRTRVNDAVVPPITW